MNNTKTLSALTALCLSIILLACKDDDPESAKCENGTFEMTLNGEHTIANSFNNTLLKGISAGTAGKRMDIRATDADGRQVIITFTDLSGTDGNGMSTDDYIPIDDITTGTENTFLFTIIENNVSEMFTEGHLDITSCDTSARKISGTFSFSFGGTEVTGGAFADMCYTIL
jgi:hypothetical protein